jgi:hypothetical protein
MKKLMISALFLIIVAPAFSQLLNVPEGRIGTSANANVGIGTSTPIDLLTVNNGNMFVRRNDKADAVIGALHSSRSGYGFARCFLMVYEGVSGHPYMEYRIQKTNDNGNVSSWSTGVNNTDDDKFVISCNINGVSTPSYGNNYFTITTDGKVGIGVPSPENSLDVNGKIRAKDIKVDASNWADLVFAPSFHLKPLSEVERYINLNGHLENIPSAQEAKEGVDVGEMQAKLLQKIEELTLYLIQKDKQLEDQQKMLNNLQKELEAIKSHK